MNLNKKLYGYFFFYYHGINRAGILLLSVCLYILHANIVASDISKNILYSVVAACIFNLIIIDVPKIHKSKKFHLPIWNNCLSLYMDIKKVISSLNKKEDGKLIYDLDVYDKSYYFEMCCNYKQKKEITIMLSDGKSVKLTFAFIHILDRIDIFLNEMLPYYDYIDDDILYSLLDMRNELRISNPIDLDNCSYTASKLRSIKTINEALSNRLRATYGKYIMILRQSRMHKLRAHRK